MSVNAPVWVVDVQHTAVVSASQASSVVEDTGGVVLVVTVTKVVLSGSQATSEVLVELTTTDVLVELGGASVVLVSGSQASSVERSR